MISEGHHGKRQGGGRGERVAVGEDMVVRVVQLLGSLQGQGACPEGRRSEWGG